MASARILLTLAVFHLTAAQPLLADPITINFSGVLAEQFGPPDEWPLGTVVTGSFTYDPAAPDTNTDGLPQTYEIPAVASGSIGSGASAVQFGGAPPGPFQATQLRFFNDRRLDFPGYVLFEDRVELTAYGVPYPFNSPTCGAFPAPGEPTPPRCIAMGWMVVTLAVDPTATLISDITALPLDPLPLSIGNSLDLEFPARCCVITYRGEVTQAALAAVPEPATMLLLGIGLAGLAARMRR